MTWGEVSPFPVLTNKALEKPKESDYCIACYDKEFSDSSQYGLSLGPKSKKAEKST